MPDQLRISAHARNEEYLVDLNATQAAIREGYSPKSAEAQLEEMDEYGEPAGVDPRTLEPDQVRELEHEPMPPFKAHPRVAPA